MFLQRPHWKRTVAGFCLIGILAGIFLGGWVYRRKVIIPEMREKKLSHLIQAAAKMHHVPEPLLRAVVWKESRFDAGCIGKKGELGLMQLMPGAVKEWALQTRSPRLPTRQELLDPWYNLYIGAWYLAYCERHWKQYAARELLQLSEYNAGYTAVSKYWKPSDPRKVMTPEDITYPGTRSYVRQILRRKARYEREERETLGSPER